MFTGQDYSQLSKNIFYELLYRQAEALLRDERDFIANMANLAALLFTALDKVNWVGFYRLLGDAELILGPFQGNPACVRIKVGQGVCGSSVAQKRSLIVPDVHRFAGHIACDSATNSEIVVPLFAKGKIVGVLDVDSPEFDRFDDRDRRELEKIVSLLMRYSELPPLNNG